MSKFFVETRGSKFYAREHKQDPAKYDGSYWQDNVPIREHNAIVGHAVRAAYLMSGASDIAAQTDDLGLMLMLERVWKNTTLTKMYVTGGIGSSAANEGFTQDYDLPNMSAYQETCASIALAQWNHRMALLTGDARYADVMERSLYNGTLAGVSLDGTRFFYVNPLANDGNHERTEWFGCACCPPNVTRTLASLGGYAYGASDTAMWVNLYIQGKVQAKIGGTSVSLAVTTNYPWEEKVTIEPDSKGKEVELRLRVPGWCEGAKVSVNGNAVESTKVDRGYIVLKSAWKPGDKVELTLPMPVVHMVANPKVQEDVGKVAVQRGPLVYCIESKDNQANIGVVALPANSQLSAEHRKDLLGGVTVLKGKAVAPEEFDWEGKLYAPARGVREVELTAIPYYAWANRGKSSMRVWLPVYAPAR